MSEDEDEDITVKARGDRIIVVHDTCGAKTQWTGSVYPHTIDRWWRAHLEECKK